MAIIPTEGDSLIIPFENFKLPLKTLLQIYYPAREILNLENFYY